VDRVSAVFVRWFPRISQNPDLVSKTESKPGDRLGVPFKRQLSIETWADNRQSTDISRDVKICELIQAEIGTETFLRVTKIVEGVPAVSVRPFRMMKYLMPKSDRTGGIVLGYH
jgi:hypothetical protein